MGFPELTEDWRMIDVGFPSIFRVELEDDHVPAFWLLLYEPYVQDSRIGAPDSWKLPYTMYGIPYTIYYTLDIISYISYLGP